MITVSIGKESVAVQRMCSSRCSTTRWSASTSATPTLAWMSSSSTVVRLAEGRHPLRLFFAPLGWSRPAGRKTSILLEGVRKEAFSMNSRSKVRSATSRLIVKDLLHKQD